MTRFDHTQTSGGKGSSRRRRAKAGSAPRLQGALGWAALALIAWGLLRNGAVTPLNALLLCLATLPLFALQVWLDARSGLPRPARAALWLALPFFAVVGWLLVQGLGNVPPALAHPVWALAPDGAVPAISAYPDAGRPVALRFTSYAMLFWILLRAAGEARDGATAYIEAIALFSTALALYGVVSQAIGYNWLLGVDERESILRASLYNRNSYATVAVFGVFANITAYLTAVAGADRRGGDGVYALRDFLEAFFSRAWVFAFGALAGLAALTMTQSRGGAVAGVVGVVVLIWTVRRATGRVSPVALAIPFALVGFVALFMSSGVLGRIFETQGEARPDIFREVIAGVTDRPLLGHGAGAFEVAFRPYTPPSQAAWVWSRAHSTYLENAFEFGLPAFGVLLLSLALIGGRLVSGVRNRRRHQSTPGFALACLAAAATHAAVDFSLQIPAIAALFAAILGIGWGQGFATRTPAPGRVRGGRDGSAR